MPWRWYTLWFDWPQVSKGIFNCVSHFVPVALTEFKNIPPNLKRPEHPPGQSIPKLGRPKHGRRLAGHSPQGCQHSVNRTSNVCAGTCWPSTALRAFIFCDSRQYVWWEIFRWFSKKLRNWNHRNQSQSPRAAVRQHESFGSHCVWASKVLCLAPESSDSCWVKASS